MLNLDEHDVTAELDYPGSEGEWYELKYLPPQDFTKFKDDYALFDYIVVDWGGITSKGKEFKCTKENKRKLYDNAADRAQWIFESAANRILFGPDMEEYIIRLGKYLATLKNGAKRSRNRTSRIANDA